MMNYAPNFPTATMISINGVELEVFEAGAHNKGNPIVLCHGWPELAYSWRYQIPVLVEAGYHVIAPNQRGYGNSSQPSQVSEYDIEHLAGDLVGLLDHYGYDKAVFMGHDWGAFVVWGLTLLNPGRVSKIINLALPYQERGDMPWIEMMETFLGSEYYFVHFNRQPGVSDSVLNAHTAQFIENLFRKNVPQAPPSPGMEMIQLARASHPLGEPLMNPDDIKVYVKAFQKSRFNSSINWYRNLDRNWHLLSEVNPIISQPTLMIHGERDVIPPFDKIAEYVPHVDVVSLDAGHCIQQERPVETNELILNWLKEG